MKHLPLFKEQHPCQITTVKKQCWQLLEFLQIVVPALRDPLLSQGRARSEEEQTILRCMTGSIYTQKDINQVKLPPMPLVPLGRHGTDTMQWNQMPLGNIDSTPRLASR